MRLAFTNELRERDNQIETLKAAQDPVPIGTPDTDLSRMGGLPPEGKGEEEAPGP